ncbi:MAG TPA: family 43 glycosylhydrolase [Eubacteriales bacterium]|nr:family 43 glycosylhydrolase [Eubacteriales bacterium]
MIFCNPLNLEYRYQLMKASSRGKAFREAADPSVAMFKGRLYLFASMSGGFWVTDDLISWDYHVLNGMPVHDYAPDARVIGDYLYFCASRRTKKCPVYRTRDPLTQPFEEVSRPFAFWDPNLFEDDDGRVYFYWGCSNQTPIYGVEMDPQSMTPIGEKQGLIFDCSGDHGFERPGEEHVLAKPRSVAQKLLRAAFGTAPYIEGAWMSKHGARYYLQYAVPGTEYNVYADGVYVGEHPLGPFVYAKNNPFSYKPGGFIQGAGHGSTFADRFDNLWHVSSMRISVNHSFERRIGLFPAGYDEEGELFCNQRYADWPQHAPQGPSDPWREPEWMLLSYGKKASASSCTDAHAPELASDEDIRTCWQAATGEPGEWIMLDLGEPMDVYAVQINFADCGTDAALPKGGVADGQFPMKRYIEQRTLFTRWLLETSADGETFETLCDKQTAQTDLPHDLAVPKQSVRARFVRLTIAELPYGQKAAVSGLRVFGKGAGAPPEPIEGALLRRTGELDMEVRWTQSKASGINVLWGYAPNRLYHSRMVFGQSSVVIGALNRGQDCFVRVDAFNEAGITHGAVVRLV